MPGFPSILSLFHNEFNKFNDIGARMLDSFYHMSLKLIKNCTSQCFIDFIVWRYITPRHNVM